jgi:hypothetical protein
MLGRLLAWTISNVLISKESSASEPNVLPEKWYLYIQY